MAFPSSLSLLYDTFLEPFGYPMTKDASSLSVTVDPASGDGDAANVLANYVDASTSPHVFTRPLTPPHVSAPPQPNPVQVGNASSTPADVTHRYADHFQVLSVRQTHQRVMDLHNDLRTRHEDMMCTFEREKEQMQKLITASAELLSQMNLMIARQEDRWREEGVQVARNMAAEENRNASMKSEVGGKVEHKSPEATRRHQGIVDEAGEDEKERHTVEGLADYYLRYTRAMESSDTLPNSPSDSDYLSSFRNPLGAKTLVCLTTSVPSPQDPPPRPSPAFKDKSPPAPRVVPQPVAVTDVASEPVAPLRVSANRWTPASRIRKPSAVERNSFVIVGRKVKALLNKLTMEKFDSISDQIISWANTSKTEKDGRTLIQVIQLVFEKATDEAAWSEMYARLCRKMMEQISPKVKADGIRSSEGKHITGGHLFRKYLLNRCQEDFERRWISEEAAAAVADTEPGQNKTTKEIALYSDEYYAAQKAKRQGLGLIKFIGELFKLQMLTERVMHECVKKLLGNANPEEEEIESLCKLLTTVGSLLDSPKARAHMDVYFSRMKEFTKSPNIALRLRFMLQDVIDLRSRRWMSRDDYDVWCIIAGARYMLGLRLGPVYPQSTLDMVAKAAHDWEEAHAGK